MSATSANPRPATPLRSALSVGVLAVLLPATANALPILSEIFYDAVGSDDGSSFVEIYGAPGTLLDGLTLEGVNGFNGAVGPVIALSGEIPPDGLFVVADRTSAGLTFVPGADQVVNFDFQNGPDSIELRDGALVLDSVGYGVFDAGEIFAGEGSPAPDAPPGSSLARLFADLDTDDNAVDFGVQAVPTPGSAEFIGVPEPAVLLQQFCGLLGIAGLARRQRRRARSRLS